MSSHSPRETLRHLGAFWQHFGIHKRKSNFSGKPIVSVFPESCPYPVWHHDEWIANANPPSATYDTSRDFWTQVWELFQKCPIPHNVSSGNENCEYTDDCWYSKNCYLCHSLFECEDDKYCYRILHLKDCQFCVFSFESERCIDLIYSFNCYQVQFAIDSKRCKNSAFLFDCEDCEDCLLCWNLRHKQYCIGNRQLTKEQYEEEKEKYDLTSRKVYHTLKEQFAEYIRKNAWWKATHTEANDRSIGDYIDHCKNCDNCYMMSESEDCLNACRAHAIKSSSLTIGSVTSEKLYMSTIAQDHCFNVSHSYNLTRCKNMEYSMNCIDCEDCFLCAGLVGKRYHILNKEFSPETYQTEKERIITDMKNKGMYSEFFPGYFAPTGYDESASGVYAPLSREEQEQLGFRTTERYQGKSTDFKSPSTLPDRLCDVTEEVTSGGYWDDDSGRPFQVLSEDITFYQSLGTALNDRFYIRRIRENFAWMFPTYELRETTCAKSGKQIMTTLGAELDGRIVSLEEYEKLVG